MAVLEQFQNQVAQEEAVKSFPITPNDFEPMAAVLDAGAPKQQARPPLDRQAAGMAGLLLGSPEFQRR